MIIPVKLDDRSYNVYIDEETSFTDKLKEMFPHSTFVLITNKTLERICGTTLAEWEQTLSFKRYIIEDGEQYKNLDTWRSILDFLLEAQLDRGTVIIAFGGGVVGDIAGFAASAFLRGVNYVQVPTTLLAMIDSGVGGKTGVNHFMGKNLIGSFYQPRLVWITTDILESLPRRQFDAGYAEMFKYAFICGRDMFDFISAHHEEISTLKKEMLEEAIKRSIEIKARIVSEDERESGKRALLNFGHTFGHALERFYNYKAIMHGEGVCWGMKCGIDLGKRIGTIASDHYNLFNTIIKKLAMPELPSPPDIKTLYASMFSDKKVRCGKLRFVLPTKPGTSVITSDVPEGAVMATLEAMFK